MTVTPIVVFGWQERRQISWIPAANLKDVKDLAITLGGGTILSAVIIAALAAVGAAWGEWPRPRRASARLLWLCLPWLILPPAILLIASLKMHVYGYTYVLYTTVPVALLAGAGLSSLRLWLRVIALGVIVYLVLPGQSAVRGPAGHGENIHAAARLVQREARPGDALLIPYGDRVPDWALAYPYGFTELRNIGYAKSPVQVDNENGQGASLTVIGQRLKSVRRLWIAFMGRDEPTPSYVTSEFRLMESYKVSDIYIRLYVADPKHM